ncbi:hypothetical protein [Nocardia sp. NBC_01327]|uniref:hypothetical protein n=1 Tax=Nocardia sp. NBC_01327 TaxID=2903593 RepID=UPI002E167CA4|nr:hypothetical protein OG326_21510 [Nocardia sp. NBC_01327]WSJ18630.1 hypothetical protein OG326_15060 [Nocardia sp. NBC_01327]
MTLAGYLLAAVMVGVFGGGAVSGAIAGHGFGIVAPEQMSATLVRLVTRPADPAAAWPSDPRPGSAWLTWLCIGLVAGLWCTAIAMAGSEIDARLHRRHRDGLAGTADLNHLALDEHSAAQKAAYEYPRLARQRPTRRKIRLPRRTR